LNQSLLNSKEKNMARFGFSANEYEPDTGGGGGSYEPIPEGEYELMCEEAEDKKTSAGTGVYIKAKFRVLGPTHADRLIFMNFNIQNPSSKAEEIGRRQVSGWAAACGKPNASDTDELINVPFLAKITIEPASGQYGPQNRINGYLVKESGGAPAPKPATPVAKPTPPAVASTPAPAATSKPAGKKAPWDE
jgi:hypothetical protein